MESLIPDTFELQTYLENHICTLAQRRIVWRVDGNLSRKLGVELGDVVIAVLLVGEEKMCY